MAAEAIAPLISPDQFSAIYELLKRIADKPYTITGASDYPALVAVGGLLLLALAAMWVDLRNSIKDQKTDQRTELTEYKQEVSKQHDDIWAALRDCKKECAITKRQIPREC